MTKTYKFMILTGKYYPDEDIKHDGSFWYFERFNKNNKRTYYEDSNGDWYKHLYNEKGDCTYYEDSRGYWHKRDSNGDIIDSGNYND